VAGVTGKTRATGGGSPAGTAPRAEPVGIPAHADVPDLDVVFVGTPDTMRPLGIKGIGEIGVVGVSAAIANAVYHATGRRIRSLPITIEQLL